MGLLHLLIAALAASAAMAADPACSCVDPEQTIDPINRPMIFFQQPTETGKQGGKSCSMNCDFTAHLDAGADTYSLQIQLLTNNIGTGSITVEGMSGDPISIGSNTAPQTFSQRSYGDTVKLHFTEKSDNIGEFMIVITKVPGRPDAPVTKPPTVAPITAPYDNKFNHNPLLVSNDIMLAFDLSSPDLDKYKTFAQAMIAELTVNPKDLDSTEDTEDCETGSRLTVVGLSSLSGFDNLYAPYWTTTAAQATGNIGSFFQIGSGPYYFKPVDAKYVYGFDRTVPFDERTDKPFTYCKNRGKIFILFSSSPPAECDIKGVNCKNVDNGDPPYTDFLGKGVHQILVNYNMDPKNKQYYELYNSTLDNVWNYFSLTGSDKDIENFFNNFLVDTTDQMTCKQKDKATLEVGDAAREISIPPYYMAKGVSGGDWTTPRHYCNFQEDTVILKRDSKIDSTVTKPSDKIPLCVKVYYDLETGKDFVSINSDTPYGQKEIVRLTGSDVSGTVFELPDTAGSIVFKSDEKNVFDGFYAKITKKEKGVDCV